MTLRRWKASTLMVLGVLLGAVCLPQQPSRAEGLNGQTEVRVATRADLIQPAYPMDLVWFAAQDPHSKGKLLVTISPNNLPVAAVAVNLTTPAGKYSNRLDFPASPYTETLRPHLAIKNQQLQFTFVPRHDHGRGGYHLKIDDLDMKVDLWFTKTAPGGAMVPLQWDGQLVYWSSPIGTAEVNGTIRYPGHKAPRAVSGWAGESERMAGYFTHLAGHRGYEYAQSGNPDGSADQIFAFPELDGTWRGIMTHTPAPGDGRTRVCADPVIALSHWRSDESAAFDYPGRIQGRCGRRTVWFTVTESHMFPSLSETTTMADGHTQVPGSVATIQHLRDLGPGFLGLAIGGYPTQLPSILAPLGLPGDQEGILGTGVEPGADR